MNEKLWESPINDWELIDTESYKLILSEADKTLKDISDDSEKTSTRAYGIITILIIVFGAVITGMLKCFSSQETITLALGFLAEAIVITGVFYTLYEVIKPRTFYRIGTEPKDLLISRYFERTDYDDTDKLRRLYLHAIEQYQDKITLNEEINKTRIGKINSSLSVIFYSLFGLTIYIALFFAKSIFFQ